MMPYAQTEGENVLLPEYQAHALKGQVVKH
jgi:hypothetical protein